MSIWHEPTGAPSQRPAGARRRPPANRWQEDPLRERGKGSAEVCSYDWYKSRVWFTTGSGDDEETHYPVGQTMDTFAAANGPGLLLLHGPGNTFIRDLAPHEQILVQPGGLIWKDRTVGMFLHVEYPRGAYWFSSAKWQAKTVWLLLRGPGRVAVQSVFERPEGTGTVRRDSGSSTRHW